MCGIVGFQAFIDNKEGIVTDMMDVIRHRGPDADGKTFIDNTSFGHVRLSIIDIEHGQQPMQTPDGRYTIILNGEIYNYLELRKSLISKGYRLQTNSDTEVLLYMFVEYGKEIVHHLNGMFAFCVYDKADKSLFVARDHFGIKPLYYHASENQFVFASEIKALLKFPGIKAEVDSQSLHEYLTFQFVLKKHTLFQDIIKLEPATYLMIRDGNIIEKKEYWNLDYSIDESRSEEQFARELRFLIEDASSIQLRSDVPVGAYLSGGIDSSAVSVFAAGHYDGTLKTFTGGFRESELYDESQYARIVSKHIKSDYLEIFPDFNDFRDSIEKLVYHMDEPAAGPGIFPQYMVSKLASEHVKVVLGGQGGDEIFGGYARYAVAYLEQCLKGAIFETQEEGKHIVTLSTLIKNLPLLKQYIPMIKSQFAEGMFDSMDRRYFRLINRSKNLHNLYDSDLLRNSSEEGLYEKFLQIFNKPDTLSYFNKMTYFDIKTLLPALLQVEDRVSMAVSLESRVPLLDKRIADLTASIPPPMKFANGKTKHIFIKAIHDLLPAEIMQRKDKMGFPVPINEWMKGPLKSYIFDIFNSHAARTRGIYNTTSLLEQIENEGQFTRNLWGALNIELWHRQYID